MPDWILVLINSSVGGCVAAYFGFEMQRRNKELDQRFEQQQVSLISQTAHLEKRLDDLNASLASSLNRYMDVERKILELKADLPQLYVRREDYVRNTSVMDARLEKMSNDMNASRLMLESLKEQFTRG